MTIDQRCQHTNRTDLPEAIAPEPMLSKDCWEQHTRKIWEEAYQIDPIYTLEITVAVTGSEVFVWQNLKVKQLRALHRALFATARLQP